jgi:hypothetical protein
VEEHLAVGCCSPTITLAMDFHSRTPHDADGLAAGHREVDTLDRVDAVGPEELAGARLVDDVDATKLDDGRSRCGVILRDRLILRGRLLAHRRLPSRAASSASVEA